jgi:predicted kinase
MPGPELAILVGLPGAGKSSFYRARLQDTHVLVSKDLMPNVRDRGARQAALVERALAAGSSVAVDNTNPRRADRAPLIAAARAHGARAVAYVLATTVRECLARNHGREGKARVPPVAIHAAARKMESPSLGEGLDAIHYVRAEKGGFELVSAG